jgi:hypothetical protein
MFKTQVVTGESRGCNSEEEEKDQLSPVSIMDFPYEEEETEEESSSGSSFHKNLAIIESTSCFIPFISHISLLLNNFDFEVQKL